MQDLEQLQEIDKMELLFTRLRNNCNQLHNLENFFKVKYFTIKKN